MSPVTPPDDSAPYRLTLTNAAGDVIETFAINPPTMTQSMSWVGLVAVIRQAIRDDREDSIGGAA